MPSGGTQACANVPPPLPCGRQTLLLYEVDLGAVVNGSIHRNRLKPERHLTQ